MPVLREILRPAFRCKVARELDDVGKAGGCHGEEEVLHVDYEEGGFEGGGGWHGGNVEVNVCLEDSGSGDWKSGM